MNQLSNEVMRGDFTIAGSRLARAGFMPGMASPQGNHEIGPSIPLASGGVHRSQSNVDLGFTDEMLDGLKRGEFTGNIQDIIAQIGLNQRQFQQSLERGIVSSQTAFPVRENLEAEAKLLIPVETPVRNMLPRTMGQGLASLWRQLTSLGGGWGSGYDQGGGGSAIRAFFAETGAPAEHVSVYAAKSAAYKLLGTYGSVTGFAMAGGANFQNQLATEKRNAILNLRLNEEHALINGDSTSTAAPWGDGSNALAFDGLINLITTANGVPAAQVQTSVGALTTAHIDNQLRRLWTQGARDPYIIANGVEILSLVHLAEASGTIIRVTATANDPKGVLGWAVTGIMHPVTGEIVPILPSRFLSAGTMLFGSKYLPDGSPTMDVQVLPQVQLPELAPNSSIEGYTAQELAPALTAPQVYAFIVTVYEVLRLKSALHVGKSTGITAV